MNCFLYIGTDVVVFLTFTGRHLKALPSSRKWISLLKFFLRFGLKTSKLCGAAQNTYSEAEPPRHQRGRAVISSRVWRVMDQQSVMLRLSDDCHFQRSHYSAAALWNHTHTHTHASSWRKGRFPLSLWRGGLEWSCSWLFVASPPCETRRHQSRAKLAGWIIHPLLLFLLLHTSDGATVTCVSSNPSHNSVCTPQAATQGFMLLTKKKVLFLSE